jgi:transposase
MTSAIPLDAPHLPLLPDDANDAIDDANDDIRFLRPDRSALLDPRCIDQLLPEDHNARILWQLVDDMDRSVLLAPYKARIHHPGRPPIDPRILITLWLFASDEGIDSARKLARLCRRDDVYRWICGGVAVSYHVLSQFRVLHGQWLHLQCRQAVSTLHDEGIVPLQRIGQDGMRVRASAGSDSMKTADTLKAHLVEADKHLQHLEAQQHDQDAAAASASASASSRGQQQQHRPRRRRSKKEAACLRGARDRCARLQQALQEMEVTAAAREKRQKGDGATTRISETDPECRKMKMPDGGFRPAHNVQFATDLEALLPVGIYVVNAGNDNGQTIEMQQQLEQDYQERPVGWYADGGYNTREEIEAMAELGITIYTPIKGEEKQKAKGGDPSLRKKGESDEVASWRTRMSSEEGKKEYRQRGKTEWTNAEARRRGLYQVRVRGLEKVEAVVLWCVLVMILLRGEKLRAEQQEQQEASAPGSHPGSSSSSSATEEQEAAAGQAVSPAECGGQEGGWQEQDWEPATPCDEQPPAEDG